MKTRTTRIMTRSTAAEAPWQIEVDRGQGAPVEYFPIRAIKLAGTDLLFVTPDGEHHRVKNKSIRKILIMQTKKPVEEQDG
jgi:hypothetical protein